uniref:Uncharacterized protein n=1 Tax=Arundo donax TaxID=35708 RepID=A0A0A8YGI7_ARUDO
MEQRPKTTVGIGHLAPLLSHLWTRSAHTKTNFRGGWCFIPTQLTHPTLQAAAQAEEWPKVGVGGVRRDWGGAVRGDQRSFAAVASPMAGDFPARGGFRGRRPDPGSRRPRGGFDNQGW